MPAFEPVIGLEIHAQLDTQSKMFCACQVVEPSLSHPNIAICEVCTGMPGSLPVANHKAVEYAIRVALALNCRINEISVFARKNYFYPDLPKGFQISQFEMPLAVEGRIAIQTAAGEKQIRIRRVHLEEDTGKLVHRQGFSLIDYNRAGVPLLEIVSEPDMHSVDEVHAYTMAMRTLLRDLQVSSGDMEKGAIRFEANVSLRPCGCSTMGTRTEIKNLNSFRSMVHAVRYEIERQGRLLNAGESVVQETLGWDESASITVSQRGKEESHDYRYFPEPDLPPLHIDPAWLAQIESQLPELPDAKRKRFLSQYGLTPHLARLLTAERAVADFFEQAATTGKASPEHIAHWLTGDLFGLLNQAGLQLNETKITPLSLAELVGMVEEEQINALTGKSVLAEVLKTGQSPSQIVESAGLEQLSDISAIEGHVQAVLHQNPQQVAQYLAGKTSIAQWFFGQVMQAARGRANPQLVRRALQRALKSLEENQSST
jgi:aspartyl-tRNA(Asn)/glutamyl-tRNA(Gln) amidotransferase subunit B